MPDSGKRYATIAHQPTVHMTRTPTKPDRVLGAPHAHKRTAFSGPPRAVSQNLRGESARRRSSPFSRPADFPILPHGFKLECPWTFYRKTYELRFGVDYWLTSAQQVKAPCDEVLVKEFPSTMDQNKLQRLQELRHRNVHTVLEGFREDKTTYMVFEYMELSLHDIATVGISTSELAAILAQVIDGLVFLAAQGLEHGSITCSNVLVSKEGTVKIGECERCHPPETEPLTDLMFMVDAIKYAVATKKTPMSRSLATSSATPIPQLPTPPSVSASLSPWRRHWLMTEIMDGGGHLKLVVRDTDTSTYPADHDQ